MERFEVVKQLGEGVYGSVWKAIDRTTGAVVAIKQFKSAYEDPHMLRLAHREAELLKAAKHPNIVQLREAVQRDARGRMYMVTEFVDHTLLDHLQGNLLAKQQQAQQATGGGLQRALGSDAAIQQASPAPAARTLVLKDSVNGVDPANNPGVEQPASQLTLSPRPPQPAAGFNSSGTGGGRAACVTTPSTPSSCCVVTMEVDIAATAAATAVVAACSGDDLFVSNASAPLEATAVAPLADAPCYNLARGIGHLCGARTPDAGGASGSSSMQDALPDSALLGAGDSAEAGAQAGTGGAFRGAERNQVQGAIGGSAEIATDLSHGAARQARSTPAPRSSPQPLIQGLPEASAKLILWQILQGTAYLHLARIIHRDLTPSNVLVSASGIVKLCDFGFARTVAPGPGSGAGRYTQYITTRWYRAPEVLLGAPYGTPTDIWSIGCLFFEMLTGRPLFPGRDGLDQLSLIAKAVGPLPSWMLSHLGGGGSAGLLGDSAKAGSLVLPPPEPSTSLHARCSAHGLGADVLKVLHNSLHPDPNCRATAKQLLALPYFDDIHQFTRGTELQQVYDAAYNAALCRGSAAAPCLWACSSKCLEARAFNISMAAEAAQAAAGEAAGETGADDGSETLTAAAVPTATAIAHATGRGVRVPVHEDQAAGGGGSEAAAGCGQGQWLQAVPRRQGGLAAALNAACAAGAAAAVGVAAATAATHGASAAPVPGRALGHAHRSSQTGATQPAPHCTPMAARALQGDWAGAPGAGDGTRAPGQAGDAREAAVEAGPAGDGHCVDDPLGAAGACVVADPGAAALPAAFASLLRPQGSDCSSEASGLGRAAATAAASTAANGPPSHTSSTHSQRSARDALGTLGLGGLSMALRPSAVAPAPAAPGLSPPLMAPAGQCTLGVAADGAGDTGGSAGGSGSGGGPSMRIGSVKRGSLLAMADDEGDQAGRTTSPSAPQPIRPAKQGRVHAYALASSLPCGVLLSGEQPVLHLGASPRSENHVGLLATGHSSAHPGYPAAPDGQDAAALGWSSLAGGAARGTAVFSIGAGTGSNGNGSRAGGPRRSNINRR